MTACLLAWPGYLSWPLRTDKGGVSEEIKEYSSEGSAPYENIKRTIKNKQYFDRPLDDFVGDRYRRLEPISNVTH